MIRQTENSDGNLYCKIEVNRSIIRKNLMRLMTADPDRRTIRFCQRAMNFFFMIFLRPFVKSKFLNAIHCRRNSLLKKKTTVNEPSKTLRICFFFQLEYNPRGRTKRVGRNHFATSDRCLNVNVAGRKSFVGALKLGSKRHFERSRFVPSTHPPTRRRKSRWTFPFLSAAKKF